VKLTGPLERVLKVLIADPAAPHYGYDLIRAARVTSGTLYPMLARLHQQGLVESEWEPQQHDAGGRPPRKYYRLTGEGIRVTRLELARTRPPVRSARRGAVQPAPGGTR
jgi:PadR family transcriptional regulator, regulatory protein PadR